MLTVFFWLCRINDQISQVYNSEDIQCDFVKCTATISLLHLCSIDIILSNVHISQQKVRCLFHINHIISCTV